MTYSCEETRRYVDAWVDGELDVSAAIPVEMHVAHCSICRAEADMIRSIKSSLGSLREQDAAPPALRSRISALLAEDDDAQARAYSASQKRRHAAGFMLAGAALAGFVLATGRHDADRAGVQSASLGFGGTLLDDIATRHARELPAEVRGGQPAEVANFFRGRMDFPVHPVWFRGVPANLVGARISNVRDRMAAALYYDLGGRRMTVFVFDGALMPRDGFGVMRATVGRRDIYVGNSHGYTVAFSERNGVGYAVATDLPPQDAVRVVATAEFLP
jgi:anti-sigma factor RsiW